MTGLVIAWGVAEGITIYRSAKIHVPPRPGSLLATSGAFVLLAILAEFAPELAIMIGVGIDIGALLAVWPGSSGTAATPGQAAAAADALGAAAVAAAG